MYTNHRHRRDVSKGIGQMYTTADLISPAERMRAQAFAYPSNKPHHRQHKQHYHHIKLQGDFFLTGTPPQSSKCQPVLVNNFRKKV